MNNLPTGVHQFKLCKGIEFAWKNKAGRQVDQGLFGMSINLWQCLVLLQWWQSHQVFSYQEAELQDLYLKTEEM